MKEEVLARFLLNFPIVEGKKDKPYIILFDAYTGMGKSTVAQEIQKQDGSVILNNDEVRHFLNDYKDALGLKDDLQRYRLKKLLRHHNSVIYDSCFCHNWEEKLAFYRMLGYPFYIIRLECSKQVVKKRLSKRTLDGTNFSIANFDDYLWMSANVKRVPDEFVNFTINTEENVEEQVRIFLETYHLVKGKSKS